MSIPAELLPAQQQALDKLERQVRAHHVTSLMGRPGAGKTTILRALQERIGGAYLTTQGADESSGAAGPTHVVLGGTPFGSGSGSGG